MAHSGPLRVLLSATVSRAHAHLSCALLPPCTLSSPPSCLNTHAVTCRSAPGLGPSCPAPLLSSTTRARVSHPGHASARIHAAASSAPVPGESEPASSPALPAAGRWPRTSVELAVRQPVAWSSRPRGVPSGRAATSLSAAAEPSMGQSGESESPRKQLKVGFLGLGIMGTAMARNLLRAGYEVTAWNRNPEKCKPLLAEGAKTASSPQEVTSSSDITIAMLADPAAAVDVACGEGKAVLGLSAGKGYIDASTVDADSVRTIAAAVRAQGGLYLEAPVSGSKKPAEDGTLIFLTGGDRELFDRASDILDVLGKYKVFLGAEGNGASMKLVVNMVMGSMMTAFSEGLALGEKAGLNPQDILDVIAQGAIASPMFSLKGPAMIAGNFPPAFPLKHQQKDLRLALALGDQVDQPLPVAAAANEVFKSAKLQGLADNDFSAVIEAVKKQSVKQR